MSFLFFDRISDLRATMSEWRLARQRIALVPTLGNLHGGHQSLMEVAMRMADRVVVSIFVNPMQFGLGEDYQNYPRTMEADTERLREVGVDVLFAPLLGEVYPNGYDNTTHVEVPVLSESLCGAVRPGHFRGVATVVCKLFNMVHPDLAVFGEKDWQQLTVIRRMVEDLALPVDIVGAPTVREGDGLAQSSRNVYLSSADRLVAPALFEVMNEAAKKLRDGNRAFEIIERAAMETLTEAGFRPDYFAVRRDDLLTQPEPDSELRELRILVAAWLGNARLIDNIPVV